MLTLCSNVFSIIVIVSRLGTVGTYKEINVICSIE